MPPPNNPDLKNMTYMQAVKYMAGVYLSFFKSAVPYWILSAGLFFGCLLMMILLRALLQR